MEEIKEKAKQLEDKLGGVLMQVNRAVLDANEELRILSQRLGHIISKFDKIDDKNKAFLEWLDEYINLKNCIKETWDLVSSGEKDFLNLCIEKNIIPSNWSLGMMKSGTTHFSRFFIKIEAVDDILLGLTEDIFDDVQRKEMGRKTKEAIEKTKELPNVMYA